MLAPARIVCPACRGESRGYVLPQSFLGESLWLLRFLLACTIYAVLGVTLPQAFYWPLLTIGVAAVVAYWWHVSGKARLSATVAAPKGLVALLRSLVTARGFAPVLRFAWLLAIVFVWLLVALLVVARLAGS